MCGYALFTRLWLVLILALCVVTALRWDGDQTDALTFVVTLPLSLLAVWVTR